MSPQLVTRFILPLFLFCSNSFTGKPVVAYQSALDSILSRIESQLRRHPDSETDTARLNAIHSCSVAIDELSRSAVGYVLAYDLNLTGLHKQLQSPQPDVQELKRFEEQLRLITPGRNQIYLDGLQKLVGQYRRLLSTNDETLLLAHNAIMQLRTTTRNQEKLTQDQEQIPAAFSALQNVAIDPELVGELRAIITVPNVQSQFRTVTLEQLGKTTLNIPIRSSTCSDRTRIDTQGAITVALSPVFAHSPNSIPLKLKVNGSGNLTATASRAPAHITVQLMAKASGLQPIEFEPRTLERDTATLNVDISSHLQNIQLDGHLNRSRIVRAILGRAVEKKLAEQDRVLSRTIEQEITRKAEEEGNKLAFKINRLLTQSLWSRLESVRFAPDVNLSVNDQYVTSQSLYAFPDQLGALSSPPAIPSTIEAHIDWTTHVHESAINNILGKIGSFQLDEATMRGFWQVQLKLTTPGWENPQAATIPSAIMFAKEHPIRIKLRNHALTILLNLQGASTRLMEQKLPPTTANFTYSLAPQDNKFQIIRSAITYPSFTSEADAKAWDEILTRLFPTEIQPIPKFRPSMWQNYVMLRYLNIEEGWLSVGLSHIRQQSEIQIDVGSMKGAQP